MASDSHPRPVPSSAGAAPHGTRAVWLCFALALLLRLGYVVVRRTWHDAVYWDFAAIAESLLRHQGYAGQPGWYWFTAVAPTAFQAPLYTFFTAACYALFGLRTATAHLVMQLIQCVVAACCVFPMAALGTLLHSRRAGVIAAAVMAVYPAAIFLTVKLSASAWAMLLLLGILVLTLRLARAPAWRDALGLGGLWGLTLLTYPTLAVFAPASGVWLVLVRPRAERGRMLAHAGAVLAVALLMLSPWSVRNWLVFHRPVPTITSFGLNLFIGNNELANGSQEGGDYYAMRENPAYLATYPWLAPDSTANDEVALADRMTGAAVDFIRRHPGRAGALFVRKLALYWWRDPHHPAHGTGDETVYLASYLLLALLGVIGMARSARAAPGLPAGGAALVLVALLMACVSGLHALTAVGQVRYRMIIEPALIPYAAIALASGWSAARRAAGGRATARAGAERA